MIPAAKLNMAQHARVASALNWLTNRVFIDALSSEDRERMSDFISDYFCVDPETDMSDSEEEEEPSKCGSTTVRYNDTM